MACATFNLKLRNFLLAENRGYTGGLSKSDLALVQSLVITEIPFKRTIYGDDIVPAIPSLRELFVYDNHAIVLAGTLEGFKKVPSWDPFLKSLRYLWIRGRFGHLLRHVKMVAEENKERAQFVLVQKYASFKDGLSAVVYFDLVEEVVWMESHEQNKTLVPDRALPGMIDEVEETKESYGGGLWSV